MSGIVAVVSLDGAPVDRQLLRRLTDFLASRGSDVQQTWVDDARPGVTGVAGAGQGQSVAAGLGHALLRTTFESLNEQQPRSVDGRVWITADARVDGRTELIANLRARGRVVADGAPDPDLILHAYHAWGEACVQHLIGDFAFALWDAARQRLLCACDQFGVVPLYYARVNDLLMISNTLDCLRHHPGAGRAVNPQAIADFLLFGSNQEPATTMFADIQRVPAGHALTWSTGALRIERYWTLPAGDGYVRYRRPQDHVDHFLELLRQAVADRLRTDRVGVLMSGGLDSTSVAATALRLLTAQTAAGDLRAYTWIYAWLLSDQEGHYAGLVARTLGVPIHYLVAEDALLPDPRPHRDWVTPFPVNFSHPRDGRAALRQAAAHGRVVLSGQGGDIALYPDAAYWGKLLKRGQVGHMIGDCWRHVRLRRQRPPLYVRAWWRRRGGRPAWRPRYPPWLRAEFAEALALPARVEQVTADRLSDRTRTGMSTPFWSTTLSRLHPDYSAVPVEVRYPFFDLRLIRYLLTVPPIPWFVDKHLLRSAMRGVLPEAVRSRSKSPVASWPYHALALKQGALPWMEALATAPELAPYVDPDALLRGLRSPGLMADHEYQSIVRALVLGDWLGKQGVPATDTKEQAR